MNGAHQRTLHIFPFSHFSEKGMWILDFKGVPYKIREGLDPFVRQRTARLTGGSSTLPVLEDGKRVIADSTDLAFYADGCWPEPRLIPEHDPEREECLLLEDWADEVIGSHARRWLFAHVLYDEPELSRKLLKRLPVPTSFLMLGFPLIRIAVTTILGLDERSKPESAAVLHDALTRLDEKLRGRAYLVGGTFTLADLTVCALLSALVEGRCWLRDYPRVFEWRADICHRHGRRKLLTDPIPLIAERQRRGRAASANPPGEPASGVRSSTGA